MNASTLFVLLLPVVVIGGVLASVYIGEHRRRQGKKPRTFFMIGGLLGTAVVVSTVAELLASSPAQAAAAETQAEGFFSALSRGSLEEARTLLTPELAAETELADWRLPDGARWELSGRDSATDAIQLFYYIDHRPVDRQTVVLGFEERDGQMRVSALQRTYLIPRPVLSLGEDLIRLLGEGRELPDDEAYAALGGESVRRLGERIRSGPGGPSRHARVVDFGEPPLRHVGRVQNAPRVWLTWAVGEGPPEVTFTLHAVKEDRWVLTELEVGD